ncbi:MAG: hypothetical protein KF768_13860 [Phycisphaeraceae bacterium]|nr:hypothetical protein [Phycisphaeraceae bacterium]
MPTTVPPAAIACFRMDTVTKRAMLARYDYEPPQSQRATAMRHRMNHIMIVRKVICLLPVFVSGALILYFVSNIWTGRIGVEPRGLAILLAASGVHAAVWAVYLAARRWRMNLAESVVVGLLIPFVSCIASVVAIAVVPYFLLRWYIPGSIGIICGIATYTLLSIVMAAPRLHAGAGSAAGGSQ